MTRARQLARSVALDYLGPSDPAQTFILTNLVELAMLEFEREERERAAVEILSTSSWNAAMDVVGSGDVLAVQDVFAARIRALPDAPAK